MPKLKNQEYVARAHELALGYIKDTAMSPPMATRLLYIVSLGVSIGIKNSITGTKLIEIAQFILDKDAGKETKITGKASFIGSLVTQYRANDGAKQAKEGYKKLDGITYTAPEGVTPLLPSYGKVASFGRKKISVTVEPFVFVASEYEEITSHTPTEEEVATAKFWAAGKGTVTPPGMWNEVAIAHLRDSDNLSNVLLSLNTALANVACQVWGIKYKYQGPRPIDTDKNFKPALTTPPFPGYVSGHSAFSAAAGTVLESYGLKDIKVISGAETREYEAVNDAVKEAGLSRIYGGIHIHRDDEHGQLLGAEVAKQVMKGIK